MDSSELLSSKENIQPLRHGRDTVKLCAGLQAQTDDDIKRRLYKERQEYETLLRDDTISDPLAVWYDYVIWLEQSFPSQAQKANINVVLKKCINKFKCIDDYKNDDRFVKLCLKYATINEGTSDIFGQLYSHGIGVKCAIFYIAWAELFAMTGSFKKASRVYEKGINRLAQPLEMLKEAEKKFQQFLVKKMLDSGEVFQPTIEIYETAPSRQPYNKLRPINVGNCDVVPNVRVGDNVSAPGKYQAASKPVIKSNGPISIYEDIEEAGIDVKPTAKLHKIKSHKAVTKENHKKAGVWTHPESKNVPFTMPTATSSLQVHIDDDAADKPIVSTVQPISALKPIQHNDEFNVDYSKTPLFWDDPYDPTMRPMYRKEQVYAGGIEFQFEELRALKYRKRYTECPKSQTKAPESIVKSRVVHDSVSKNLKLRPSEEIRSARHRAGEDSERRGSHSARKSAHSNFAGVVRRTLVLDSQDPCSIAKSDAPSESFINQTIHTKEAVNEMQELWFAKPATSSETEVKSTFQFYVDESCLGKDSTTLAIVEDSKARGIADKALEATQERKAQPICPPMTPADEENKENAIPIDYAGTTGKSTRPVTGILTLSDNVPYEPIIEEGDEDDEEASLPEAPGNTTGITETWNFTQAFSFPKTIHASTPNVRRSVYRPVATDADEPASVPTSQSVFENRCVTDTPLNLKVAVPPIIWTDATATEEQNERHEVKKNTQRTATVEQRTLGEMGAKNLSIIVETSREYKSSSSGSSACSKLQPFTPSVSCSEMRLKGSYYSQVEESRKTTFASKTQSTYGYEASAELSCTGPKSVPDNPSFSTCKATGPLNIVPKVDVPTDNLLPKEKVMPERMSLYREEFEAAPIHTKDVQNIAASLKKIEIDPIQDKLQDIDPFDEKMNDKFLEDMDFPFGHHVNGCNFMHSKLPPVKLGSHLSLGGITFDVKKVLGEGAYAKVFRVQSQETSDVKVLKYQKPAFLWEFYIAREIHNRCTNKDFAFYFMVIEEGYFFENASLLVSAPVEYGDLLTAINLYKTNQGKSMSDFLVLYFTVQILDIIEKLHSFKIIHGDVKPDNFLVKKMNGKLVLELIDFGRSIDMTLFPPGTSFTRVVTTEGLTCVEMQTGRSWTYQLDLYGVAGCIHCLLFGEYMKVVQNQGIWETSKVIPRYLAKSGWKQVFRTLLNIPTCTEMPDLSELRTGLVSKLEAYGAQSELSKLTNFLENH